MEFRITSNLRKVFKCITLCSLIGFIKCNLMDNFYVPCNDQEVISQSVLQKVVSGFLECAVLCSHASGDIFVASPNGQNSVKCTCYLYIQGEHPCEGKTMKKISGQKCYKKVSSCIYFWSKYDLIDTFYLW